MGNNRYFAVRVLLCLALAPAVAASGDDLTLKEIMQGLRDDFVKIGDGLLHDNFEQIADGAMGIAEHPKIPPDQVKRVATELGEEMPGFKLMDKHVHDLSLQVKAAAEASDRDTAMRSYLDMMEGCMACHVNYKERIAVILSESESALSEDSSN